MAYTTIKKASDYFNTVLYTGDGTSPRSITGVGFQPDFLWIKDRSTAYEHRLMDAVRGSNKVLFSSTTSAELSEEYYTVSSFDSDGWTGRNGTGTNQVITGGNDNGDNFVAWNWLGANGTASNTDGGVTTTVSANTTSGFSVFTYTGNGATNLAIGHGLGVKPKVFFVKNRGNAFEHWQFWIDTDGDGTSNYRLLINETNASYATNPITFGTNTITFSAGDNGWSNNGENFVGYAFAEKQGFSKFGSYIGNGNADGPFIYTGFKPAFILVKNTSQSAEWEIYDNKRAGYNPANYHLNADDNSVEAALDNRFDLLSNGWKVRTAPSGPINTSGNTYIYMAFAEEPLVGDNPATAR